MSARFEKLLSPVRVGGLHFKNRIYKPPSGTKLFNNTNGYVSEEGKLIYEAWAKGGAGCIVVESPAIGDERSIDIPNKYLINDDKFIPGLTELVDVIHKHDCPALLQLYHAGQWHLGGLSGLTPVSSSPHPQISELAPVPDLRVLANNPPCDALSLEGIEIIEQQFIDAAERAAKAGFDGLELGAGANHLLASFASRYWNSRNDKYGCDSYENRARIVVNIIKGIKSRLGDDFTIILTINGVENNMGEKGITEEETLELVKLYEAAGADAFQPRVYELYNRASYWSEQYFYPEKRHTTPAGLDFSHRGIGAFTKIGTSLKQVTAKPIVIPGKWDSDFAFAEEMLEQNKVDVIAVCRGLFADTDLPVKMQENRFEEIAPCTACLSCLTGGMLPIRCRINAFIGGKEEYNKYPKTQEKKKVLVVGAGPAGLEAARVSALRGHEVVLYSKEGFIGGLMNMASVIKGDYPEDIQAIVEYYRVHLKKLKVKLVKGKEADLKTIEKEKPDVVFLATGASVGEKEIPGSDHKIVVSDKFLRAGLDLALKVADPSKLSKATEHWMPIGKTVVVMGGDVKGVQLAEFLTKRNRKVTLVCEEDDMQYGEGLPRLNNFKLGEWFKEKGVEIIKNARFEEITKTGLVFTTKDGTRVTLSADSIVPVYPLKTNEDLYESLQGKVPEVYAIGACKDPKALIVDAVEDAAKIASSI
jgi:2,4-dienoyl-CoA reductase (NADPH2)